MRKYPNVEVARLALSSKRIGERGQYSSRALLARDYMRCCYTALGGNEDNWIMVDAGLLRPVEDIEAEATQLMRKVYSWAKLHQPLVNPTAARFALIQIYRLSIHFGFVETPAEAEEIVLLDLDKLVV